MPAPRGVLEEWANFIHRMSQTLLMGEVHWGPFPQGRNHGHFQVPHLHPSREPRAFPLSTSFSESSHPCTWHPTELDPAAHCLELPTMPLTAEHPVSSAPQSRGALPSAGCSPHPCLWGGCLEAEPEIQLATGAFGRWPWEARRGTGEWDGTGRKGQ